jgi:hypothetical protein
MSEEERVAELEDALSANDELLQKIEEENKELRELNAELLGLLKEVIPILIDEDYIATVAIIQRQIAKAEKLK